MAADEDKIGKRYVDGDEVVAIASRAMQGVRADARGPVLASLEAALYASPRHPRLAGGKEVAKILGVAVPNVSRMRTRGKLPEAIPVAGSYDVYDTDAIEALAAELRAAREARDGARA